MPAAPAASRFCDLMRLGARAYQAAPPGPGRKRSPRASIRAAKTPYVNACVALSRSFRSPSLRPASLAAPAAPGVGGAARGTPKMGSSRGLSRDFQQSPSSRVPDPLYLLEALPVPQGATSVCPPPAPPGAASARPPPGGRLGRMRPIRPVPSDQSSALLRPLPVPPGVGGGSCAASRRAGSEAIRRGAQRGAISYALAATVTSRRAIGTAPGCPALTSRPGATVSPTSRASRWLGSAPCQAPSGGVEP